jgi:hypothetical protein
MASPEVIAVTNPKLGSLMAPEVHNEMHLILLREIPAFGNLTSSFYFQVKTI